MASKIWDGNDAPRVTTNAPNIQGDWDSDLGAFKSYVLALWTGQDSLLQSYRGIFITTQSIFIALTTTLYAFSDSTKAFAALPIIVLYAGFLTNIYWVNLANERGLSVYIMQTILRRAEAANSLAEIADDLLPFSKMRRAQDDLRYMKKLFKEKDFVRPDPTRSGLNFYLPVLFLMFWIVAAWEYDQNITNEMPVRAVAVSAILFASSGALVWLFLITAFRQSGLWSIRPLSLVVIGLSISAVFGFIEPDWVPPIGSLLNTIIR